MKTTGSYYFICTLFLFVGMRGLHKTPKKDMRQTITMNTPTNINCFLINLIHEHTSK